MTRESAAEVGRLLARQAEIATESARIYARLAMLLATPVEPTKAETLLTPEQAAEVANLTREELLTVTRGKGFPFRRKLSHKSIRFEEAGLRRWLMRSAA